MSVKVEPGDMVIQLVDPRDGNRSPAYTGPFNHIQEMLREAHQETGSDPRYLEMLVIVLFDVLAKGEIVVSTKPFVKVSSFLGIGDKQCP